MKHTKPPRPFLTAEWRWLVMLNYEVDSSLLEEHVPRGVELDFFQGRTYVSLVGFLFLDTRLLGWPVPWHRHFEEVNLRYYVRRVLPEETRRGVVFIKELVPRRAIALTARAIYNEPYQALPMRHAIEGFAADSDQEAVARYEWRLGPTWNSLSVTCDPVARPLNAGSHEQFIAEHYWGYCRQRDGGTVEYQVEHPSWRIYPARHAKLDCQISRLYGEPFVDILSAPPSSAFVADGSAIAVHKPRRV